MIKNWPNWRSKLEYNKMKPNILLNNFMKEIEEIEISKNNELQCLIHNREIIIHCEDWRQHLWPKWILTNEHNDHIIQPISKKYIEKVKEARSISNQINQQANYLENNINFMKKVSSKTLEKGQAIFNQWIDFLKSQVDSINDKIMLFFNKRNENIANQIDKCNWIIKELEEIANNGNFSLEEIFSTLHKVTIQTNENDLIVNSLSRDLSYHDLCSVSVPSIFEFTLTNSQLLQKPPMVKMNKIEDDIQWSFYIETCINMQNNFDVHIEIADVNNPKREFHFKIEINVVDQNCNSIPVEITGITNNKGSIYKLSMDKSLIGKDLKINLIIQRIDPSVYSYIKKIEESLDFCYNSVINK